MYLTRDVPPEDYVPLGGDGVKGVRRHRMLHPENSTRGFALRAYIIEPGGHTSMDTHQHEHGVYVLRGRVTVVVQGERIELGPGDVIHIAGGESHQFMNEGDTPVKFLCVRDFVNV